MSNNNELRYELNRLHNNSSSTSGSINNSNSSYRNVNYNVFGSDPFFSSNDTIFNDLIDNKTVLQRIRNLSNNRNIGSSSNIVKPSAVRPVSSISTCTTVQSNTTKPMSLTMTPPRLVRQTAQPQTHTQPQPQSSSSSSSKQRPSWLSGLKQQIDLCDVIVANETKKEAEEMKLVKPVIKVTKPLVNNNKQVVNQPIVRSSTVDKSSQCTALIPYSSNKLTLPVAKQSNEIDVLNNVNINENNAQYNISMNVPGVDKKQLSTVIWASSGQPRISISASNDQLNKYNSTHNKAVRRLQRICSHVTHTFCIPDDVELNKIRAKHDNSKLIVTLPKIQKQRLGVPRTITIQ